MSILEEVQNLVDELGNDKGLISDGSHNFNDLYYHRMVLFSTICKLYKEKCFKSKQHADGTMYYNYFIVGINTPEGDYSYHYHMDYWNYFDVPVLERAPEWDGHESKDVTRLWSLMEPKYDDWLQNEIDLACGTEDCYGRAIYNSAAKAYMSLVGDSHSGMSIGLTKQLLNRMIEHKPLTLLTGEESEWSTCWDRKENYTTYQNKRYSGLFKDVYDDGTVKFHDVNRFTCEDLENGIRWHSGLVTSVVEPLYPPIVMPYSPPDQPIVIYMEDFLLDPNNGDYDHKAILYAEDVDKTRVDVNVFMKEVDGNFIAISRDEYYTNKQNRVK